MKGVNMETKYLCMAKGCGYVAEDHDEAMAHASEKGADHAIVEVMPMDGDVDCMMMSGGMVEEEETEEEEETQQ
jgi:hypothetical protein